MYLDDYDDIPTLPNSMAFWGSREDRLQALALGLPPVFIWQFLSSMRQVPGEGGIPTDFMIWLRTPAGIRWGQRFGENLATMTLEERGAMP